MDNTIVGLIVAILMVVAHIIKSINDAKNQQPNIKNEEEELVLVTRSKQGKSPKVNRQPLFGQQPLRNVRSVLDGTETESLRRQTLIKKLSPQGEGQRFDVDPGTLDATQIVAPTIDPTVKPELESITGIYEQEATSIEKSVLAMSLNIIECLAKPEGLCQAVILAEILNRPAWRETTRQHV